MPTFTFTTVDEKGERHFGSLEAQSEEEVINLLQSQGSIVLSVKQEKAKGVSSVPAKAGAARVEERKRSIRYHRGIKLDDLLLFCQQMATLVDAGVPLLKSLEILISQVTSKGLLDRLEKIKKDVVGGMALHAAIAKHPEIFSRLWVDLIRMGESSGTLPQVLNQLTKYMQERQELSRKLITASVYPILLIFVAIGAISMFTIKIVPVFGSLFKEIGGSGAQLPLLTRIVISISDTMRHFALYIFIGLIVAFFGIHRYRRTDIGRYQFDKLLLKLPLVGGIIHELAIQRFTNGLSTLLNSGVSILHALDISGGAAGNKIFEIEIAKVKENVKGGKSLAEEMEKVNIFTSVVINMVRVGEESGRLSEILGKVSKYYEERVSASLARLTIAIEPLMLIFMGGIIGTMVVSMFLPIFQLASVAGRG